VKKEVQDKIDAIIAQAKASGLESSKSKSKSSINSQDSLAKALTNKKDADKFLNELEVLIKFAQDQ
jgi:hypothetical protein